MTNRQFLFGACILGALSVPLRSADQRPSVDSGARLVRFVSIEETYASCSPVRFSVHNVSSSDIYVEVYAEDLASGTWTDVGCPYDLRDPRSRRIKRVPTHPKMIKPGASDAISYDRCSDYEICRRVQFGSGDPRSSRRVLQESDSRQSSPVLQRFRVEVYLRQRGQLRRIGTEWSPAFARVSQIRGPG